MAYTLSINSFHWPEKHHSALDSSFVSFVFVEACCVSSFSHLLIKNLSKNILMHFFITTMVIFTDIFTDVSKIFWNPAWDQTITLLEQIAPSHQQIRWVCSVSGMQKIIKSRERLTLNPSVWKEALLTITDHSRPTHVNTIQPFPPLRHSNNIKKKLKSSKEKRGWMVQPGR